MNLWWLEDIARVDAEKAAVEALAAQEPWFELTRWVFNAFRFSAEGEITAHGAAYPVRLIYPDHFPAVPAWVEPQDGSIQWSVHQYGPGGPLCLELRPDNWHPDATGADMLRSAYNLLEVENPLGEGAKGTVPSGHRIGAVQRYDWGAHPTFIGEGCHQRLLAGQSAGLSAVHWVGCDKVAPILIFDELDRERPELLLRADLGSLRWEIPVLVGRMDKPIAVPADREALGTSLSIDFGEIAAETSLLALAVSATSTTAYHSLSADRVVERKFFVVADEFGLRSNRAFEANGSKVAIVGLGSVGSKVAEILLRSGIQRFVLVDGDVMLPANLERHTLDWRDVGSRKVAAVKRRLTNIVGGAAVEIIAANLNWQRSAKVHADDIEAIAGCDLIIDASGDGPTAYQLGAIASNLRRPFVSATVFEGGLGCLVARSIPGVDPAYAQARAAYHAYCEQQDVAPPSSGTRDYEALSGTGQPMVADDAAATMAAGHAARTALDILDGVVEQVGPAWRLFGFKIGWLFTGGHGHNILLNVGAPPLEAPAGSHPVLPDWLDALVKEAIVAAKATS